MQTIYSTPISVETSLEYPEDGHTVLISFGDGAGTLRFHLSPRVARDVARALRLNAAKAEISQASEIDTQSSVSRQHYIDTGTYMTHAEVQEAYRS